MNKSNKPAGGNNGLYEMTYGGSTGKNAEDAFLAQKMQARENNLTVVPVAKLLKRGMKSHRDSRETLVLLQDEENQTTAGGQNVVSDHNSTVEGSFIGKYTAAHNSIIEEEEHKPEKVANPRNMFEVTGHMKIIS
jgi:hypothetical protein